MSTGHSQIKYSSWFNKLLRKNASQQLLQVLDNPHEFRYQIIYTKIDRNKNNEPHFTPYYLNVDENRYFNPASMVKLPTALMALEKLHAIKEPVTINTAMFTDSSFNKQTRVEKDETAANGLPSIEHYIKKIFLISDNDAYNRLYEFVGQKQLNESLWQKGYKDMRIRRRFYTDMTLEENRHTNPIRFVEKGQTIYIQQPQYGNTVFDESRKILLGKAYLDKEDKLVNEPMDFTTQNNAPLEQLQQMLQAVLYPSSVPAKNRFDIAEEDLKVLYRYMSQLPSESKYPKYDTTEYFDSYTKFFFFKDGKQKIPNYIRSFNKTGWSYGFLTDVCYIVDFKNKVEFMLSGNIYVNKDGVLNDNKYEYAEIGYPFFREIGEKIYTYELNRKRKFTPDLSHWIFEYE
ncbi:MAG: serine hydrolase [Niabella sp.]